MLKLIIITNVRYHSRGVVVILCGLYEDDQIRKWWNRWIVAEIERLYEARMFHV